MRKEITGILLFFIVLVTAVSLFSYSPDDPSINNQVFSQANEVRNQFGLVGAHIGGLLVELFGLGAFWVPVLLLLISFLYLKDRSGKIIIFTVLGGALLVISTGSLLTIHQERYLVWGRLFSSGGMVGIPLTAFLLKYANTAGCIAILILLFSMGFILATGVSLVAIGLSLKRGVTYSCSTGVKKTGSIAASLGKGVQGYRLKRAEKLKEIAIKPVPVKEKPKRLTPEIIVERQPPVRENIKNEPVITKIREEKPDVLSQPEFNDIRESTDCTLPSVSLLSPAKKMAGTVDIEQLKIKGKILEDKLGDFGISGEVVEILPGPVITTFEYRPAPGIKISKIVNLTDDLALALSAVSIRIIAPIPGKDVIGVEIPNNKRQDVSLQELIVSSAFTRAASKLTLALGKDILGLPVTAQLDAMPHLLIAGATGTGKSVGLNAMIVSLLYKATPDEVKMIMIDPKRIELSVYDGIPHLISPVVTDMKKATNALLWGVREMERRYELLANSGVRNILQYNSLIDQGKPLGINQNQEDEQEHPPKKLPYIVVVVDEFADLMMVASREVESALIRLAQMARAAGIHLIMATQRPSVNVLTGIIKANFPTRISFQVSSRIDSRTILDSNGSERLLGNGDMLFLPPGTGRLIRIQCAYISEAEIARITGFLKEQKPPEYVEDITKVPDGETAAKDKADYDEKYDEAVALVTRTRQASISSVQRHLRIGYNRAARIIEVMETEGVIGPADGSKPREVLVQGYGN